MPTLKAHLTLGGGPGGAVCVDRLLKLSSVDKCKFFVALSFHGPAANFATLFGTERICENPYLPTEMVQGYFMDLSYPKQSNCVILRLEVIVRL